MDLVRYPEYKDSGIWWIGEIPEHWSAFRIKDYLNFNIGGTPPTKVTEYFEGENIWVSIADINSNEGDVISDSSVKISDEAIRNSNVKLIHKGSLLYSFKLSVGLTAFAGCDLYTNEAIASFEPNEYVDLNFLKYVFKAGFENNANVNIYGAKLFNSDLIKFSNFVMPFDITEQKQIANYLDNKTAKIDKTIENNQKLIGLLEEKRVALINHGVTKGLNPDVEMKDSGIEWIGNIPENWNVVKLKFLLSKIGSGITPKGGSRIYVDKGIPLIRSQNIQFEGIKLDNVVFITNDIYNSMINSSVQDFDVLLNITGASLGRCCYVFDLGKSTVNQHVCILRPLKDRIYYKFLNFYLMSILGQKQIFSSETGASREGLSFEKISNFQIILPPLNIQKELSKNLENKSIKIQQSITKIREHTELLEEYKESLIYNVVTGKVDVRGEDI